MLFLTNDAPDAAAAVSEAASAVGAALEDGTASTVGFFQKIFGGFSWTKLISAAILLVVCGVLIKLILKATDRMLGRSRLDKAVHLFIRNDSSSTFSTQYHISADRAQCQNFFLFIHIDMHKYHHRKKNTLDYLSTITPLMYFLLNRKEVFNTHFR